ncbi:hypothetical protein [Halovivax cerinus]|uniref:Uncharacterized protein n=1 Tax=Halovivax cerinus TaxID=1487865 RepID=A0ABD5NKH5_9EURY|nr:hypothetical protein [Halovivax cerinus]
MKLAHVSVLEDFGNRSLLVHGLMVIAFANAVLLGLLVDGQFGAAAFVALLGFTAGLWVSQSIHSLGSASTTDYDGVLNELIDVDGAERANRRMYRFGRILALVAAVTAISLLTSAQVLSGAVFAGGVVAIGSIAVVTSIVGFIVALGASYDESQRRTNADLEAYADTIDVEPRRSDDRYDGDAESSPDSSRR